MNTKNHTFWLPLVTLVLAANLLTIGVAYAQYGTPGGRCNDGTLPGQPCNGRCISERSLCILEPVPGFNNDEITPGETIGMGAFFHYINNGVWQYAFGFGIGAAVFAGVVGGLQIVMSNGDSGKSEAGKSRLLWAVFGLILLLMAGIVLEFLNPFGFRNV